MTVFKKFVLTSALALFLFLLTAGNALAADNVSMTYNDGVLRINSNTAQSAVLIQAAYDEEDFLLGSKVENITIPYTNSPEMYPGVLNKFMLWDSTEGIRCLYEAYDTTAPAELRTGISECEPYQYTGAKPYMRNQNEWFTMAGNRYTDGFVMESNGTDNVLFNLDENYESVTFKVGHIDGTDNRDRTLKIYLDRVLVQEVPLSYSGGVQEITVSTSGARGMKLEIEGVYYDDYGFADFEFMYKLTKHLSHENNWTEVFEPYQYSGITAYRRAKNEKFKMSGDEYTDGFVTSSNGTVEALFNLEGRAESLTFTVGHIDGTDNRNRTLNIYLDRVLMYEIPLYYDEVAKEHTISLLNVNGEPASQMKFEIQGTYYDRYGFSNGLFKYSNATEKPKENYDWLTTSLPTLKGCILYQKSENSYFTMSGDQYTDGFVMKSNGTDEAVFNIERKYKKLRVTIGHVDGTDNRNRTLTVYLDDVPMEEIPLYYDEIAKEYEISLLNIDGIPASMLKFRVDGVYYDNYGFANGKFE